MFGHRKGHGKKGGKEDVTSPGEAIQKLRETEGMLIKKQDFLEKKIETETANARRNARTNKQAALQALKRKKRLERQLQQIDGTLTTLEYQKEALENATTNTAVLQTMGETAKVLKKAHNNMDPDKVHDLMDDIAEQQDVAREITDAISNPVAFGYDIDEDDLEAEFNDLITEFEDEEQKQLDQELLKVGPTPDLPEVPVADPVKANKKRQEDEDDLKALEAWAT